MPTQHPSPFYGLKPGNSFGDGAIYIGSYECSNKYYCVVERLAGKYHLSHYSWFGSCLLSGDVHTTIDFWEAHRLYPTLCCHARYAIKVLEGEHPSI